MTAQLKHKVKVSNSRASIPEKDRIQMMAIAHAHIVIVYVLFGEKGKYDQLKFWPKDDDLKYNKYKPGKDVYLLRHPLGHYEALITMKQLEKFNCANQSALRAASMEQMKPLEPILDRTANQSQLENRENLLVDISDRDDY